MVLVIPNYNKKLEVETVCLKSGCYLQYVAKNSQTRGKISSRKGPAGCRVKSEEDYKEGPLSPCAFTGNTGFPSRRGRGIKERGN